MAWRRLSWKRLNNNVIDQIIHFAENLMCGLALLALAIYSVAMTVWLARSHAELDDRVTKLESKISTVELEQNRLNGRMDWLRAPETPQPKP